MFRTDRAAPVTMADGGPVRAAVRADRSTVRKVLVRP